jgi:hypothetical protein
MARSNAGAGTLAVAALAMLMGVLAACTPTPGGVPGGDPSAATALPAGVEIELFQLRSDVAERGAQVRVVNGSGADLTVSRLVFDDDWFDGPAVRDRESAIAAGRTVDLRIALPESACEAEPDASARTSRVTLTFSTDTQAGVAQTATVDVADPLGFTALMHEKECLRHDLARVATLKWTGFTASTSPQPAELQLSITPAGGAGVARLIDVQTTNLLQFGDQPAPVALEIDVSANDPPAQVAVALVPLRCDPHAVMEDKRGTVFNVTVEVDGASGVVEVAASEAMRGEILRWVSDWCGFGPGA